jgi:Holliday junction resolvasome RuvABC endonuclease subunit
MKSIIKQLFFDREMVEAMKVAKTDREVLYTHLINGKITMKEYIAMTSK